MRSQKKAGCPPKKLSIKEKNFLQKILLNKVCILFKKFGKISFEIQIMVIITLKSKMVSRYGKQRTECLFREDIQKRRKELVVVFFG